MNKKGFVFIEMIVTTVILLVALLLLYTTYSKVISNEKQRLYFDDIAYVYKAEKVRDVVASTIDYNNFYKNINNNNNGYVYLFGYESEIFQEEKSNLKKIWEYYNVSALGYVRIEDIRIIKSCLNGEIKDDTPEEFQKCKNTEKHLKAYSKSYITSYLKTLDVDYDPKEYYYTYNEYDEDEQINKVVHDGILIVLFEEYKNGTKITGDGGTLSYKLCIQNKVLESTERYCEGNCTVGGTGDWTTDVDAAVKKYRKEGKESFDMSCEYGYNLAWVYF